MADYIITGPDGKKYKVSGEGTQEEALAHFKQQMGVQDDAPAPDTGGGSLAEKMPGGGGLASALSGYVEGVPLIGHQLNKLPAMGAAAIGSLINGGSYADNLARAQGVQQKVEEEHPYLNTGGKVVSGVANTLPLMEVAPGLFGAQKAALGTRVLTGAGGGFGLGAADTAMRDIGSGKSTSDKVINALIGGSIGGITGGLAPTIPTAAGNVVRYLRYGRSANQAARAALPNATGGTGRAAVDAVARSLGNDEALAGGQQVANAAIDAAGPRAMLADAGPSTRGVLDTAIARGGPNTARASTRILNRAEGAAQDINTALDRGLGPEQGITRPLTELRTSTAPARSAAYDAAYAQPIDYSSAHGQRLQSLVENRVPQHAIRDANELMRIDGIPPSRQIHADIADDGTATFRRLPDVRQLDYITRGLRSVAAREDGAGALGGTTDLGNAYRNLSQDIRSTLGDHVPEYRTALNTARDPIAHREAMQFGQDMLQSNVPRDAVESYVHGLTDPQLQSLRTGVRSRISETLANVKRTAGDPSVEARAGLAALKDLSSPAARQKLSMIMDPAEAQQMFRAIDEAGTAFDMRAGVARGSQTYGRQAAERAVNQFTQPGFGTKLARLQPVKALGGLTSDMLGAGAQGELGLQDEVYGHISDLLTQPAQQGGGRVLQSLRGAARALPAAERAGDVVDRNAMRLANPIFRLLGGPKEEKKKKGGGGLIGTVRQGG